MRDRQIDVGQCVDASALIRQLAEDSAATILTEESLEDQTLVAALRKHLACQPNWSDYRFVVL